MQKSGVFEQTYQDYVQRISGVDYLSRADVLGAAIVHDALVIQLYNRSFQVSASGIHAVDGRGANDAIRVILAQYVLRCPLKPPPPPRRLMTFREFQDSAPLTSYFVTNTYKTIEQHFGPSAERLREKVLDLQGVIQDSQTYDVSAVFQALPRIPVVLNFNARDEEFPAGCSILYQDAAEHYLDMECLAMTGTLLAGLLLR